MDMNERERTELRNKSRVLYSSSLADAEEWKKLLGQRAIDNVYFDVGNIPLEQIPELSQKLQASILGIPNLFEPFVLGPLPYPSESLIASMDAHFVGSTSDTYEGYARRRAEAWERTP